MKTKEILVKAKTVVKKHKVKLALGGTFLLVGGYLLYCRKLDRCVLKKLEELRKSLTPIEGSGPVWEKIKACFADISMNPGEMWMIEAGTGEDAGLRRIAFFDTSSYNPPEYLIF